MNIQRFEKELVAGWLHVPDEPAGKGFVLTHGAGTNATSPLLQAVAQVFCEAGFHVLRCDLPYRQLRASGPPMGGAAARDREGLRLAATSMREITPDYVILGGHSYGGRQASILAAEFPEIADRLLLLSYPLHPPRKPEQLRTAHFPQWRTPVLFVHGTRDPFGLPEEMRRELEGIPAPHRLFEAEKVGHELKPDLAPAILQEMLCFESDLKK